MTALQFLKRFPFASREAGKMASGSELQRWLKAGNVWFNGEQVVWDEQIDFPIISLVLFPKGNRITLL